MMLRSSSTPVLGSLLSSISAESHQQHDIIFTTKNSPSPHHKLPFHQIVSSPGSQHFNTISCSSSPISPSVSNGGFRRAQSEGNLQSLINSSSKIGGDGGDDADDFSFFTPPKKFSSKRRSSLMLETIPSFSFHNSRFEDDGYNDDDDEEEEEDEEFGGFHAFSMEKKVMTLNEEMRYGNLAIKDDIIEAGSKMYIAKGIGIDQDFGSVSGGGTTGAGGGGRSSQVAFEEGGGGNNREVEDHYKKMVNENPGNSLFLRNYAQLLYESKKDLQGAEEYYSRAILVDPNDGEILSQYAKLIWELHHDKGRATGYYERAVQAASEDSHVHAAYASFLWEIEGDEDEEEDKDEGPNGSYVNIQPVFNNGAMASATA